MKADRYRGRNDVHTVMRDVPPNHRAAFSEFSAAQATTPPLDSRATPLRCWRNTGEFIDAHDQSAILGSGLLEWGIGLKKRYEAYIAHSMTIFASSTGSPRDRLLLVEHRQMPFQEEPARTPWRWLWALNRSAGWILGNASLEQVKGG